METVVAHFEIYLDIWDPGKTMKNISQGSQPPSQGMNSGPAVYEANCKPLNSDVLCLWNNDISNDDYTETKE
jgi:hypothetical protein